MTDKQLTFGAFLRNRRKELRLTLREFCRKYKEDPGNWSKLERGKLPPPKNAKRLEQIEQYLNLWDTQRQTFRDLAAIGTGTMPPDLMTDEELVSKLPILFKRLRDCDMDKLIEIVRNA